MNSVTKGLGATQQTLDLLYQNGAKLDSESKVEGMRRTIMQEREERKELKKDVKKRRSSMKATERKVARRGSALGTTSGMESLTAGKTKRRSSMRRHSLADGTTGSDEGAIFTTERPEAG